MLELLKSGSQAEITMLVTGQAEKYKIEVAPQLKTIFLSDMSNRPITFDNTVKGHGKGITDKLYRKAVESADGVIDIKRERSNKISF